MPNTNRDSSTGQFTSPAPRPRKPGFDLNAELHELYLRAKRENDYAACTRLALAISDRKPAGDRSQETKALLEVATPEEQEEIRVLLEGVRSWRERVRARLAGSPPVVEPPTDTPTPVVTSVQQGPKSPAPMPIEPEPPPAPMLSFEPDEEVILDEPDGLKWIPFRDYTGDARDLVRITTLRGPVLARRQDLTEVKP